MADLPTARVTQATGGGGVGAGSNILCVMSCTENAVEIDDNGLVPVQLYRRVQEILDDHGKCEGLHVAAHNAELNGLPTLFVALPTVTAGALGPVNTAGVTGTSTWTFSGTPLDDERIVVECTTGGTRGTAGVEIRTSRDGGTTWSGKIGLGTATSYLIPDTGVTVAFSYGTLVEGDSATAACVGPRPDASGIAAGYDSLVPQGVIPRIILQCSDVATANELQTVCDEIDAHESEDQRFCRVLCALPGRSPDVAMQKTLGTFKRAGVVPADVDFAASADTITRDTGSWVDDGFVIGQSVTVAGSASNNGVKGVLSNVSATVLTLPASPGLSDEANVAGTALTITGYGPGDLDFASTTITRNIGSWVTDGFKVGMYVTVDGTASNDGTFGPITEISATVITIASGGLASETNVVADDVTITGTQRKSAWRTASSDIVGATPQTAKVSHRTAVRHGKARRKSPVDQTRKMRNAAWWEALRTIGHQENTSPARMDVGGLEGVTMHDATGQLEHEAHDERVESGMLANRIGCLTTSDDLPGVFVALPVTLDLDNANLSRLPVGEACDLAARIAKREATLKLSADFVTNLDGTIKESEALAIEKAITNQLRSVLVTPGSEGSRVSDVTFTMERGINILTPGVEVPCEVLVTPKGYLEQIRVTIRVNRGGG